MKPNIALIGKARSGKDTVATHLVEHCGYKPVSFAGPLKAMALEIDPMIMTSDYAEDACELSWLLRNFGGWERVKDEYPDSRRFLQNLGSAVRSIDEGFWLRAGMDKAWSYSAMGYPVVFTDVRYSNEATALRHAGYTMVRVVRPTADLGAYTAHASETELDGYAVDEGLTNDSDVSYLLRQVEELVS